MSAAGYSTYEFGTWPNSAPLYPPAPNPISLYVDPTNGHDVNNQSASQAKPLRSLAEATRRIVAYSGNVDIRLQGKTYPLPDGGVFLESRMLNGRVRLLADETWDPGVFETVFSGTALAGTNGKSIAVNNPSFPVDAFVGMTIETTHGGVTQRRTVRNSPKDEIAGDSILPVYGFTNGVVEGDAFRIFTNNTILRAPDVSPSQDAYIFAADCPSSFPIGLSSAGGSIAAPGLRLEGVSLAGSDYFAMQFGRVPLWLYGVQHDDVLFLASKSNPAVNIGTGNVQNEPNIEGWGLGITNDGSLGFYFEGCAVNGYIAQVGAFGFTPGSNVVLLGGRFFRLFGFQAALVGPDTLIACISLGDPNAIPTLFDTGTSGSPAIQIDHGMYADFESTELFTDGGGGILVASGGTVHVSGPNVTGGVGGGIAVHVEYGQGRYIIDDGAPALGDPLGTDYVVDGAAAPQNKSFFAAAGDSILGLKDSSVIVRIS